MHHGLRVPVRGFRGVLRFGVYAVLGVNPKLQNRQPAFTGSALVKPKPWL